MDATRMVDGKKQDVALLIERAFKTGRSVFEEQRARMEAQQRQLPGAQTAAQIGMDRAAVEKAARGLREARAAWRAFEGQLYSGKGKVDAVLRSHLGV